MQVNIKDSHTLPMTVFKQLDLKMNRICDFLGEKTTWIQVFIIFIIKVRPFLYEQKTDAE